MLIDDVSIFDLHNKWTKIWLKLNDEGIIIKINFIFEQSEYMEPKR